MVLLYYSNTMKVTTKGQVTIPLWVRKKIGISASSEVDFVERDGNIVLVKDEGPDFSAFIGIARGSIPSTDEWLDQTRERP
jgi:AbrB family looped-hinge helix DNA binding protein